MEEIIMSNESEFQSILDAPNVISNDLLSIVTTTTNEIWLASYCSLDHHCHVYRYTTRMEKQFVFSFHEEMKSIQLQLSSSLSLVQVYGLSKNDCIVVASSSTTVVVVERNKSWLWGMDTIRYWKNDWFLIYSTTITFLSAILWNCQTKQRQVVTLPETTTHAFTTTTSSTIHWMGWNAKTCTIHHSILHHPNQSTTTTVVPWILPSSTIIIHLHHDEKKKELYIITTMGQIYIYNYSLSTTTTPKIIQPSIQLIHTPIQSACITTNHVLFYNTIQNGNVYYTSTILNKKDNVQPQKLPIQNTICHLQSSSISSSSNEDDDTTIVMFASTTSHRLQVFQMNNNNNNNMNQTNMNIDLQSFFQSTTKKTLINNNTETNEYDSIIQQLRTIACQSSSPTTTTTTTIETSQDEDNHLNLQLPINHTISKDVMTKTYHVLYDNYNTTLIHHPKSEQQQPLYHYTTNSHSSSFLLPDQTDDLNGIPVFYNGTVISYCSNNKQTNSSTKLPLWNRNPIQILTSRSIPFPKQQQQIIQSSKHVTKKRKQNSSSHYHGHPYLYSKRCKTYNKEFDYTQYQYINDDINQTICHGQIMIDSFHHHDIFHPMIKQQSQQIIEYSHLSSWQRKQNQILQQQQQQAYRLPMDQEISILSKYKQQQQISTESKSTTNNNNVQHLRFYYSPSSTNLSSLLNIPNKNNDDDQVLMVHHNKGGIYSSCMVVGKYNERVPPSMFVDLAISARSQLEALNIALLVRSSIMKQLSKRELPPIKDFKMIQKIATYLSMKLHNHTEKTITMDDVLQLYCQIRSLPLVIE